LAITIYTDKEWDIFDLKNVAQHITQSHISIFGYLKGYAYSVEITRIINYERGVDYVFGVDIPCISKPRENIDFSRAWEKIKPNIAGENGIFLIRCFNDLSSAMKYADDTGFYCYRAIEALRHHCAAINSLSGKERDLQWKKFREVSGVQERDIRELSNSAQAIRHGGIDPVTGRDREAIFISTWNIVDAYIAKI